MSNSYALALHGGAGAVAGRDYSEVEAHLQPLATTCAAGLAAGKSALDVVEQAVVELEACGLYVAGRGSAPNSAGYVELDASIMDGHTREAGAVAIIRDVVSPISAARRVMDATDHVMLAGNGAEQFARAQGFEFVSNPAAYYRLPVGVNEDEIDSQAHGTVGAVALDSNGRLAAATSTGGTFNKMAGRVGDSPLVGAGTWADDKLAISCTGTGEHIIRAGGAVSVAIAIRHGVPVDDAVQEFLDEIARLGGDAGLIVVTAAGDIVMEFNSHGMKRASIGADEPLKVATFRND